MYSILRLYWTEREELIFQLGSKCSFYGNHKAENSNIFVLSKGVNRIIKSDIKVNFKYIERSIVSSKHSTGPFVMFVNYWNVV